MQTTAEGHERLLAESLGWVVGTVGRESDTHQMVGSLDAGNPLHVADLEDLDQVLRSR